MKSKSLLLGMSLGMLSPCAIGAFGAVSLLGLTQIAEAQLPESFTVTVDKGGGQMVELNLSKYSIRSANCRIVSWDSTDGYVEEHTQANPAMPARTYRGTVTGEPNVVVIAVVNANNTISAQGHNGSGKLWDIVGGQDVTTELGNGTSTVPTPATFTPDSGTTTVAAGQPGQYLPAVGLYRAHGVEDVTSQFYDLNGQDLTQTMAWLEYQWNIFDYFNTRDAKLSMELTEVIIRKEQFYFPPTGSGQFTTMLRNEWAAQGQNKRGFVHSWFPYNFTYAGGYASGNEFYGAGHCISVNALYHEVAHNWRAQHYFYGRETMTGSKPAHTEMNSQRILYTRQIQIDQDDGIEQLSSYATNVHPRAYQDIASTLVGTAVNISPLENDYDANGDAISLKEFDATTAKGGTVTESNGVLTYTPAAGYVGKDVITYAVQDTAGLYTKNAIHIEVINQGLAAHWKFEETSGTTSADDAGHGHAATLVGADFGSDSITGPVGKAVSLGAANTIIGDASNLITGADTEYPLDDAASNFFDPMDQSFTVATWFKLDPGTSSAWLVSKRNQAALGYLFSASTASGLSAQVRPWDGLEAASSVSGGTIAEDTWYHAAMVINRTDNTLRIYLDGVEVGTAASISPGFNIFNGRADFTVGGSGALSVDEMQVYTKPLTAAELVAMRNAGEVPAGQPTPVNMASNVPSGSTLEWVAGNASYQHDVYFGTDEAAVAAATTASPEYKGRQTATSFDPGSLEFGKNYFWRVDQVDGSTIIGGKTWRFSTAASAINENLVLHLTMDDADVQVADGVIHTYDDIAFPANDFNPISVGASQAGVIGQAVDLTATADALRSKAVSPVSKPANGGVTVSFWINTTSAQDNKKVYDGGGAYFMRYYNGNLQTVFDGSSGGALILTTGINDGQWHHVVAQNDGAGTTTVYVDGVVAGSQSESLYDVASLGRHFSIGSQYGSEGSENFDAAIDDFAVWERALSVDEITAIHTAGLAGNSFNDVPVLVDTSFEASEGFTDFTAGGLKALGTVTDNLGVTWTGVSDSQIWNRTDIPPAGVHCLAFGVGGSSAQTDVTIPGTNHGVGTVTFDYASFSGSANATFKLSYNDNTGAGWIEAWSTQVIGMNPSFSTKPWGSVEVTLNVPGDVDLRFETSGTKGAKIDNVKVTGLIPANTAPVANDGSSNIAENAANGSAVHTVVATDADAGDTLSYAITAGNTGNTFAIDANGAITTAAALDHETTDSYTLTVTVTDSSGATDTATVTVNVTDVNEAPTATNAAGSVAENTAGGVSIATVTSSDPDAGDSATYAITVGNAGGAFAINSSTGEITTTAALDYEAAASHTLTVTVTDGGGLTDTATVNVTVTNVNEGPTVNSAVFAVAENSAAGTTVGSVTSSDPDAGDSVTYAITAGNAGGEFAINSSTGVVTTTTALDYETASSYSLTVTATDNGGLNGAAVVTVNVTNVNEAPTANDATLAVAENASAGAAVGSVTSSDPDASDSVSYAITAGNAGGEFAINSSTGAITTTTSLDFESGTTSYGFTVTATDGGGLTDTAAITVNVSDVNEAPVATDASGTVAEDVSIGTAVATVSATDVDAGDTLTYAITAGNEGGEFAINANTGEITTAAALDYETTASYSLTVTVTDAGGLTDTATVTVTVTDVVEAIFASNWAALADQNPVADPSTYFDGTVATSVGTIDFENVSGNLRLWNGSNVGDKDFIGSGGSDVFENVIEITSAQYANDTEYTLSYVIGTGASSARTGDWFVEFGTRDGGVFTPLGVVDSGSASSVTGSLTLNSDENLMDNVNNSALFGGNVGGRILTVTFNPGDAATGENIAFRFGTTSSNLFAGISNMRLDSAAAADPNLAPVANDTSGSVAEDAAVGTTVLTVTATDPNAGDTLNCSITAGNTGDAFAIDANGDITTAVALDYETTPSYNLTVTFTDQGGLTDTAQVAITVVDVAEVTAPEVATGSSSNLTQTSVDVAYNLTDDGGEASTVTVFYGTTDGGTTPENWDSSSNEGAKTVGGHSTAFNDLTEGSTYYYTVCAMNSAGEAWGSTGSFTTEADTSPKMVRTTVNAVSNTSWTAVDLGQNYNSAVIVATPIYTNTTTPPVVTRIRNVSGSGFEVKLDRADGGADPVNVNVSIIAVEEGVYTQATDGVTMEAVKYTSSVTADNNNWAAEARTYQNTYTSPVVVGQVMSANDANWSTFWSMGSSRTNPADASNLNVGKHVGEDPNATRANETIGYIVIEAGNGTINGVAYEAALGADTVRGFGDSTTPYTYSLSGNLTSVSAAAASISGMDGNNGAWAVLSGSPALTTTSIGLHAAEDQLNDSEQKHTTTQVGYIIFE